MCLAIPARVLGLKGQRALIEQPGAQRLVFNNVIQAKEGEYVLVQQGFIVERIPEKEALETLEAMK